MKPELINKPTILLLLSFFCISVYSQKNSTYPGECSYSTDHSYSWPGYNSYPEPEYTPPAFDYPLNSSKEGNYGTFSDDGSTVMINGVYDPNDPNTWGDPELGLDIGDGIVVLLSLLIIYALFLQRRFVHTDKE